MDKWTGLNRTAESIRNPKITSDIYLHFSTLSEDIKKNAYLASGVLLDIGSGTSPYRPFFINIKKYITLDFFHNKQKPDIIADALNLPIKDNSIDTVLCTQVLEHSPNPQLIVDEIHRVLKPGGICFLTTHMATPLHGLPHDYFRFTHIGLKVLFRKFNNITIKANGGSLLAIFQYIAWSISEKFPRFLSLPLIVLINLTIKPLDRVFHDEALVINYLAIAKK